MTILYKDLTSQHKDLTRRHKDLTSDKWWQIYANKRLVRFMLTCQIYMLTYHLFIFFKNNSSKRVLAQLMPNLYNKIPVKLT